MKMMNNQYEIDNIFSEYDEKLKVSFYILLAGQLS